MSLLPPNASALEKGLEAAFTVPAMPARPIRDMWNPATCPEHLLPWLAWSFSVDNWDAGWPIAVRRSVIASAIAVQRRKGTIGAVRRALASFGAAMALREWWEVTPRRTPGTFEIILALADQNGVIPSAEFVDAVVAEVDRVKPLSRHFTFAQALEMEASIGLTVVMRPAVYARLVCTA